MSTKLGRNEPCHCGSGKKYKKCHLALDEKAPPAPSAPVVEDREEQPSGGGAKRLRESGGRGLPSKTADVMGWLARSGLIKRDPALRRLFKGKETLLKYMEHQQAIDAAFEKLVAHEEEFLKLLDDDDGFAQRTEELFAEEPFAPMRFTAAEVVKAFEQVGFPPNVGDSEEADKVCVRAILFLAPAERRSDLAMELLMRMPDYVEQGRFLDARLISYAAQTITEEPYDVDFFLAKMFAYGADDWADGQDAEQRALLREAGLDPSKPLDPEEIDKWISEMVSDPVKDAQLRRLLDAHPELRATSNATLKAMASRAVDLLQREDATCLFLRPEEVEEWVPFLTRTLTLMMEKYGPAEEGETLSETQQTEAFSTLYLPAMREVTKGIFVPERIRELVTQLKSYRKSLFAAGEKDAAFWATGAINYVEGEDDPTENVFLVNLCARSIHAIGEGGQEEAGAETAPEDPPSGGGSG